MPRIQVLNAFAVKRAHIELFARSLEQEGKARATVARRLSTIAGFYRYCVEEQLLPVSPATHVRRPKVSYESNAVGLDRNELGMLLVQAGLCGGRMDWPRHHSRPVQRSATRAVWFVPCLQKRWLEWTRR